MDKRVRICKVANKAWVIFQVVSIVAMAAALVLEIFGVIELLAALLLILALMIAWKMAEVAIARLERPVINELKEWVETFGQEFVKERIECFVKEDSVEFYGPNDVMFEAYFEDHVWRTNRELGYRMNVWYNGKPI